MEGHRQARAAAGHARRYGAVINIDRTYVPRATVISESGAFPNLGESPYVICTCCTRARVGVNGKS